jgi:CheY-like chemotaxis protein
MPKILIVEDNEMNRDMLGRRLRRAGYDVVCAVDGPSGIAAAASDAPDLILMDVALGAMDGWEVTRCLKQSPITAQIPVIALTAHAFPADRVRSVEVGCVDFDTKPVDFGRLTAKIKLALQKGV